MLPDSAAVRDAIAGVGTVVVVDSWMSDTAREADVILPVATLLEDDDLVGAYGHHYLGVSQPVVPPRGEAKTDLEILQALAARVGLEEHMCGTPREWKARALNEEVDLDDLEDGPRRNPLSPRIAHEGRRFQTPSGKARLLTRIAVHDDDEEFPLKLIAVSTPSAQSSQQAVPLEGPAVCRVHPSVSPVDDGQLARLVSRIGTLEVHVVHDAGQRADVCWMDKGGDLMGGRAANKLVSAAHTDFGEGAALYDEGVCLEKL